MEQVNDDEDDKMEFNMGNRAQHKDSFYFSRQTTDLLIQGWTIITDNQFILVLLCLLFVSIFVELGRRLTRELIRKIFEIDTRLKTLAFVDLPISAEGTFTPLLSKDDIRPSQTDDTNNSDSQYENVANNNLDIDEITKEHSPASENENEVWETNQRGRYMQVMTTKYDVNLESTDTQIVPLGLLKKRNFSFDMGINRWETDENYLQLIEANRMKRVSDSKTRAAWKRLALHSLASILHVCQIVAGYLLMLVVMSYNFWFLVIIVAGAAIGYALFSWDRIRLKIPSSPDAKYWVTKVDGVESSV